MNDLTQLMERATEDLRPDVAALVAGSVDRGRRLRTRRRAATGVGALAAVAAVGVGVILAPTLVAGSPSTTPTVLAPASSPTVATRQLPTRAALAGGDVVRLPAGTRTVTETWGNRALGSVGAAWLFTPASGGDGARVDVFVQQVAMPLIRPEGGTPDSLAKLKNLGETGAPVRKPKLADALENLDGGFTIGRDKRMPAGGRPDLPREPYTPEAACRQDAGSCRALPDGTWVSSFTMNEPLSGGGDSDIVGAHATLYTLDGFSIAATAYNALGEKYAAVTRTAPVIDESGLVALVRNAAWS